MNETLHLPREIRGFHYLALFWRKMAFLTRIAAYSYLTDNRGFYVITFKGSHSH